MSAPFHIPSVEFFRPERVTLGALAWRSRFAWLVVGVFIGAWLGALLEGTLA